MSCLGVRVVPHGGHADRVPKRNRKGSEKLSRGTNTVGWIGQVAIQATVADDFPATW